MTDPNQGAQPSKWKPLGLFLTFLVLLTALPQGIAIAHTKGFIHLGPTVQGARLAFFMWAPGHAAIFTRLICGESLRGPEWKLGEARHQWAAYLIPLGYSFAAYIVIWGLGLGGFPDPDFTGRVVTAFGMKQGHTFLALGIYFVTVATVHILGSFHLALGEEVGWRGFLLPELMKVVSLRSASLLVGVIWFAWHVPSILWNNYNNGAPMAFTLTAFFVVVMSASVIMANLFAKWGSVWAMALFHASHNAFLQNFFDPVTAGKGESAKYLIGEFGVPVATAMLFVAIYSFVRMGAEAPSGTSQMAQWTKPEGTPSGRMGTRNFAVAT